MQRSSNELTDIQRELSERSLADFIRIGWPNIDPADYISNWHIDAIAEHLEAVSRGHIRNLIINIPPRHMKSLATSVAWPAWTWIQDEDKAPLMGPNVGFLNISYAQSLSVRDSVKCRRLIQSNWYQENWGDRFALTDDQNTKIRFENDHQGYRIASSTDGTATGEGGDVCLIDDSLSASDANSKTEREKVNHWYDDTMSTRLNNPKTGAYVLVAQRLHELDLIGHLLAKGDSWTHLCLPARYEKEHPHVYAGDPRRVEGELLWPARMGEREVAKLEASLGSYGTAGQLQQRPAPSGGGIFKTEWWKYYKPAQLPAVKRIIHSWDTGFKTGQTNDYSCRTIWAECENGYYLLDVWKQKVEFPDLRRIVGSYHPDAKPTVIIVEDKASGQSLIQELLRDNTKGHPIVAIKVETDKISRAYACTPVIEGGRVYLPEDAPWLADYVSSLASFPNAAHDDDVDSTTQALAYLTREQFSNAGFYELVRKENAENAAKTSKDLNPDLYVAPPPDDYVDSKYSPGSVEYARDLAASKGN